MNQEIFYNSFEADAENFVNDEDSANFLGAAYMIRKKLKKKKAKKAANIRLIKMVKARKEQQPLEDALQTVTENTPQVKDYLNKIAPEFPTENATPATLAAAVSTVHSSRINSEMKENGSTPEEAEENILNEDIENEEIPNEFIGGILGSVLNAGKAFLTKVNEKRKAQGKKPFLAGKAWKKLKDKVNKNEGAFIKAGEAANDVIAALKNDNPSIDTGGVKSGIKAAADALTDTAKKDFLKENGVYILGAVFLLVVIGYFIRKSK